jgi:hypothetical protein
MRPLIALAHVYSQLHRPLGRREICWSLDKVDVQSDGGRGIVGTSLNKKQHSGFSLIDRPRHRGASLFRASPSPLRATDECRDQRNQK